MKEGGRRYEDMFAQVLEDTGYEYKRQVPIRIENPVENREGQKTKTVTVIDFEVRGEEKSKLLEITTSKGNTPHKEAQFRVLEEAGISNIGLLSSGHVVILERSPNPLKKRLMKVVIGF